MAHNKIYGNELLDNYGSLLTKHQLEILEEYYIDDLSMAEIAENYNISKAAISDIEKNVLESKNVFRENHPYTDITWQVITNRNALIKLSGSSLTDVMSEEAIKYSRYSGEGITVMCYDKNGDIAAVRSIPWEDLGVDIATATSFTYHIPDTDPPLYVRDGI